MVSSRLKGTMFQRESRLKGTIFNREADFVSESIGDIIGDISVQEKMLTDYQRYALENGLSLSDLIGGETDISTGTHFLSLKKRYELENFFSVHKYLKTGFDYKKSFDENSKKRYKVYLSLMLDTNEKIEQARNFIDELFSFCIENNLSMSYKISDHNYDSFNLYTWDFDKIKVKLQELYKKYSHYGIFNSVHHFFQGEIEGTNPMHIGYVQEPYNSEESHSTRMKRLGKLLENGSGYINACKEIGVKAEKPWELSI